MPTSLGHIAPVVAIRVACGNKIIPFRFFILLLLVAVIPDIDVLGFRLGIPYADPLGHRGLSHSFVVAGLFTVLVMLLSRWCKVRWQLAGILCFFVYSSHIILDAFTYGGLGVAALWPYSAERFSFAWQPIPAAPFSLRRLASDRGLYVLWQEFRWVWCPFMAVGISIALCRWMGTFCRRKKNST